MYKFMGTIAGKDAPFRVSQYLWVVCIWSAKLLTTTGVVMCNYKLTISERIQISNGSPIVMSSQGVICLWFCHFILIRSVWSWPLTGSWTDSEQWSTWWATPSEPESFIIWARPSWRNWTGETRKKIRKKTTKFPLSEWLRSFNVLERFGAN